MEMRARSLRLRKHDKTMNERFREEIRGWPGAGNCFVRYGKQGAVEHYPLACRLQKSLAMVKMEATAPLAADFDMVSPLVCSLDR